MQFKTMDSPMFHRELPVYNELSQNEYLDMVNDTFSPIFQEVDILEIKGGYNRHLDMDYVFNTFTNNFLTNLGLQLRYTISVSSLGSAYKPAGKRFLKGSCSIRTGRRSKDNNSDMVLNWLYTNKGISSLIMLEGDEKLSEVEQIKLMLPKALEYVNMFLDAIHENFPEMYIALPDIQADFPEISELFFI